MEIIFDLLFYCKLKVIRVRLWNLALRSIKKPSKNLYSTQNGNI